MGLVYGGIPRALAGRLREACGCRALVETGTCDGTTAEWAAGVFACVHTIEASAPLHAAAQQRLSCKPNVVCWLGDSRTVLPNLLPQVEGPILFWLDAHYCGATTYQGEGPLLDEIRIVNRLCPEATIMVDDARHILAPWVGNRYCTVEELVAAMANESHGRYMVVIEDMVVAVPAEARQVLDGYCHEVTSRVWEEHSRRVQVPKTLRDRVARKLRAVAHAVRH